MASAGGQGRHRHHPLGIEQRPFQRLQAAHGSADHQLQAPDAERVDQRHLETHLIADRHPRKAASPGAAIRGRTGRTRGAVAAAEHIAADDEIAFRIQQATAPEQRRPPVIGIRRAGQGVTDQDGVVCRGRSSPPGAIGDLDLGQPGAGFQPKRPFEPQTAGLRAEPERRHAASSGWACRNARSKSALMSSMCSMPTDTRIRSGRTPA